MEENLEFGFVPIKLKLPIRTSKWRRQEGSWIDESGVQRAGSG